MIGIAVGAASWPVGRPDLLHAFFSTISGCLEPDGWGSRFPALLGELYQGRLTADRVDDALAELLVARRELAALPPSAVVWDIDDLDVTPPWGSAIDSGVPDLARYFITSDGRDLVAVLANGLSFLRELGVGDLQVVSVEDATVALVG